MRRPRRRCLRLLLLVTAAALGTGAVTVRRRRDSSVDPGWGGKDGYYRAANGLYCQKCPPGTFIAEDCKEQNGSGSCQPCEDGEFVEYPNPFRHCQDCGKCREDQVQVSACRPVRNTECACRNGTFCPPEHPCEMCQKCQPRCPEGQVVLKPCTPTSDLQCGPATDTSPAYLRALLLVMITMLVILLLVLCAWCCYRRSPGDGRPSSRRPYEVVSSMFRKLPWYRRVNTGTEDNVANTRLQGQQPHTAPEPAVMLQSESGRPKRSLVPVPGIDPIKALRRSFYTFAEKIRWEDWRKFGCSLDLEENDLVSERTEDAFYQMLSKWLSREGSKASVNTLLETLGRLHLGGVAENISSALVQNGLFQYETS